MQSSILALTRRREAGGFGRRVALLALALAGVWTLPVASAADAVANDAKPRVRVISLEGGAPRPPHPRQQGDDAILGGLPYRGVRAEANAGRRVGFFGVGKGIQLFSGGTVVGVEGGASLRLRGALRLRGSYRLVDYDVPLLPGNPLDRTTAGPFLGFDYRF